METNFFSQIAKLEFTGKLQLTIAKGAENNLVVSVLLNNEQCADSAKHLIPPLAFNAKPQEFDEGFFDKITEPVQSASGLMIDMENYLKQLEEAKKQSAMEREKTDREKKEKEARDKKYREAMQKADELEKQGKYREAWVKVPEPTLYPEHEEEIRKRRTELAAKFAPDLFGTDETAVPQVTEEAPIKAYPDTEDDNENETA